SPALRQAVAPAGHGAAAEPPASPLLLTMLTILHYNRDGRPLPPERDELYEKLVDLLLHRWEPRRGEPVYERDDLLKRLNITGLKGSTEPLRRVLHEIAFKAHMAAQRGGDGRGAIDGDTLTGRLGRYFRETLECPPAEVDEKVGIFLEVLRDDAGLLSRLGDNLYAFPHLTFQEYLAGCYLADRESPPDDAYARWLAADADRWREALLLMSGRLRQTNSAAREGVRWLKRLARERYPVGDEMRPKSAAQRQRDALLAAECYEVLGRRTRIDREQWEEVEDLLRAALEAALPPPHPARPPQLALGPRERDRAALALAQLGDPRPGVCALPHGLDDPYWADPIPAGTYPIANGTATVRLGAFRVARYLATVWQFRRFWEDPNGYENERLWPKSGWEWKQRGQITQPYLWDNPDWTADNQPVVGVSWYEAAAFCAWLEARGREEGWLPAGWRIRLPSEAEWEVAAMWDAAADAMRPWAPAEGELWQNVAEAGIGRSSPVGLFPQGASPCGALDMAGNVWEWCASHHEDYPRQADRRRDDFSVDRLGPTLRGGSYYLQNISSGWGARDWFFPYDRGLFRGFRVAVCSAPRR
ncbi:MAG TPA: SUMF1/EgtB/PvdO family nonheme iron enzyme, partial [Roseiflexaceae bacterium]|nr:SUMF1/EgtB/PvdO family nonheme iron enzyme [Roseiflexaceae bacterium]